MPDDNAVRTTITFPRSWIPLIDQAVEDERVNRNPGARLNDIYREALYQYLVRKGYLKDGDQR